MKHLLKHNNKQKSTFQSVIDMKSQIFDHN